MSHSRYQVHSSPFEPGERVSYVVVDEVAGIEVSAHFTTMGAAQAEADVVRAMLEGDDPDNPEMR